MKASVKFRDDGQKPPLFRAKVPLTILGLPFQSGIVAGNSKELSLNISTFFDSGPSLKIAYRPNDSWNPFSFVVKTGTGNLGSPAASPLVMSAEFNLIGNGGNPRFMLHLKPRLGDFSIKKSQTSLTKAANSKEEEIRSWRNGVVVNSSPDLDDGSLHAVELEKQPGLNGIGSEGKRFAALSSTNAVAAGLSGLEVAAETKLPVRNHAVVSFQWGLRVPAVTKLGDLDSMISFKNIPILVMNKIGIELVSSKSESESKPAAIAEQKQDLADTCSALNRQLEMLQRENGLLRKAMEDLRQEFGGSRFLMHSAPDSSFSSYKEPERNRVRNAGGDRVEKKKVSSVEHDVSEELKKALKGAGNGGA